MVPYSRQYCIFKAYRKPLSFGPIMLSCAGVVVAHGLPLLSGTCSSTPEHMSNTHSSRPFPAETPLRCRVRINDMMDDLNPTPQLFPIECKTRVRDGAMTQDRRCFYLLALRPLNTSTYPTVWTQVDHVAVQQPQPHSPRLALQCSAARPIITCVVAPRIDRRPHQ